MVIGTIVSAQPRKKLAQRAAREHSQTLRHMMQFAFLLLNVWIGVQFYLFVRYYESGGQTIRAGRPAGVEGWLPIASLMNLKVLLLTGSLPEIHPAGTFLLIAFLAASWIFRKSFCGWLCPVGTVSEYLWRLGRRTLQAQFPPCRARWTLACAASNTSCWDCFCYAVARCPWPRSAHFSNSPYGMVDDVKMLNFFRDLGVTGGVVMAVLVLASISACRTSGAAIFAPTAR